MTNAASMIVSSKNTSFQPEETCDQSAYNHTLRNNFYSRTYNISREDNAFKQWWSPQSNSYSYQSSTEQTASNNTALQIPTPTKIKSEPEEPICIPKNNQRSNLEKNSEYHKELNNNTTAMEKYHAPPVEIKIESQEPGHNNNNENPLRNLEHRFGAVKDFQHPDRQSPEVKKYEEEMSTPKLNPQGKLKAFTCKQCVYSAVTKEEFWAHAKIHIKPEKMLTCPQCPFVTELKHHLEYHMRNHEGSKPFRCNQCDYSCVNKSMLNSHLKSHSPIYQYRCSDCPYVAKHCHSFKIHLRKTGHKPGLLLNPDGTESPYQAIDVYGTRRGPKQKSLRNATMPSPEHPKENENLLNASNTNNLLFNQMLFNQMILANQLLPFGLFSPMLGMFPNMQNDISALMPTQLPSSDVSSSSTSPTHSDAETSVDDQMEFDHNAEEEQKQSTPTKEAVLKDYSCEFCAITFKSEILFTYHMYFHGSPSNPFQCSRCKVPCENSVQFHIHLTTAQHDSIF